MLKSKNYLPPGGWVIFEPLTNWSSPSYLGFDDTVRALIAHRAANRGRFAPEKLDFAQVSVEVEQQVEARLRQTYGEKSSQWLTGAPSEAPPNFPWQPHRAPLGVVAAGGGANRVVSGVKVLLDWIGDGLKPVDQALGNQRASVCVACPLNQPTEGIRKAIQTVGDALHSMMRAKTELKLATPHDAKLESCTACLCSTALKVWTPIAHIKKNTTKEIYDKLHPSCWIRKEWPQ